MDDKSNFKNNNKENNNIDYISRMIRGITDANSIRPAITPESIPSFLTSGNQESGPNVKDSMSENINSENEVFNNNKIKKTEISFRDHDFNINYNTSPNSPPNTQESGPNVKDSMSENINSENEVFNNNKIKKTEISFRDPNSNASSMINVSNKKIGNSNSNLDLSSEKVTKSHQSKVEINTEISNLNKSDNLSSNLKIKNIPDVSYKTKIIPEAYISNKNNIDFERMLHFKDARDRLQKNQIVERTYEPTITINIGKITVRYIDNNNKNSKNIKDMTNGMRNSNKLSLTDYLKKRAEINT